MCQEKNVVAIATLTPEYGKIMYKVGNRVEEKKITIKKNPNNSDYYGGTLEIDDELQQVLKEKITTMSNKEYHGFLLVFNSDNYFHWTNGKCWKSDLFKCFNSPLQFQNTGTLFFG